MSCCDEPSLLPIADALARMRAQITAVTETETVPLHQALDRVLAQPIKAAVDVPTHDNSAMDGYALRAQDSHNNEPLALVGTALAGHAFRGEVAPGTCVRIMTGAAIPTGADCVVMQENTASEAEGIRIHQAARKGENIRRRGEDIASGSEVLACGHRLGPVDVGLLASLGENSVEVYRRLRVAVVSTGDELVPPGQPLADGQIYDSNRYSMIAMLQRLAVEVIDLGLIPDQPDVIADTFVQASQQADAVISSGGVSVGDADYVKDILSEIGEINFWKVAIKPGKPFAFGKLGQARFFGLPGNPVSAVVTLHQLALPILQHMAGERPAPPVTFKIKTATPFKKRPGRSDYQRALVVTNDQGSRVSNLGTQSSGVLTSFSATNCYVVLEQDRGSVEEGEVVDVLPFDRWVR